MLFEYLKTHSRSRLLVTTHNDGLLDLVDDLIRKDSVWFTEKDKAGVTRGRISRLEIFDASGTRIGYIKTDGTVCDGESRVLGTINLNDGKVTDASQRVLGFARGIRVDWIACYYFFDFFKPTR